LLDFVERLVKGGTSRLGNMKEHDAIDSAGCGSVPVELYLYTRWFILLLFMWMRLV
jgi:hypothetical protein